MKVLNKYFKVVLCFIAFALCSFMFAFTPTYTAVQAAEVTIAEYKKAISALRMPTEKVDYASEDAKVNAFRIPLLSTNDLTGTTESGYTIRVYDPSGYPHDYVVGGTNTSKFFETNLYEATADDEKYNGLIEGKKYLTVRAQNDGEYKVVYIVKDGNKQYYSNVYKVQVINVTYELDFSNPKIELNSETGKYEIVGSNPILVPKNMAVSSTKFYLPVAYAKQKDKDLKLDQTDGSVDHETVVPVVRVKNAEQDVANSDYFKKDAEGRYYIIPSVEGEYVIEYSYGNSENRPLETFSIYVEEGYKPGELKLASTPTMPTFELGKTIKLPKLSVNAGNEKNVETKVQSVVIEKEMSNGAIRCELTNNNLEFTMSPEYFSGVSSYQDLAGNYRVTYTVVGAHEGVAPLVETFKIEGVTVVSNPTIKLAYNYDNTKKYEANDQIFTVATELEAEYLSSTSFAFPAAYVEDYVTTNWDDFYIERAIRKNSTYYYLDNRKYDDDTGEWIYFDEEDKEFNASGDANIGDPNKIVEFKFNTANDVNKNTTFEGTYYLEYRVISKQVEERQNYVYSSGSSKYSFKIVAEASTYNEPTVTISNLKDSAVKSNQDIIINVTATDDIDTRLKTVAFTYTKSTGNKVDGKTTFEDYVALVMNNLETKVGTNKSCHVLDDERLIKGWDADGKIHTGDPEDATNKGLAYYFNDVKKLEETETKNNFKVAFAFDENNKVKTDDGKVRVVAISLNDGVKIKNNGSNLKAATVELTIKDTDDEVAPEINIYAQELPEIWNGETGKIKDTFEIGQGKNVELPSVYVVDAADDTLSLNVMYYIVPKNAGDDYKVQYFSPSGKDYYYKKIDDREVQIIDGGYITTSEVGTYYVAYTATDVAGNTTVKYFTFEVYDTSKPILTVEPVTDATIAGNTITGDQGTVIDFEVMLKSHTGEDYTSKEGAFIDIDVDDGNKGLDYTFTGNSRNSLRFDSYGTYTITIYGEYDTGRVIDDKGNDDPKDDVTEILKADKKVIKVVIEKQTLKWLDEFDVPKYAAQGKPVILPDIKASNGAQVSVTYIAPGDSADEAKEVKKDVDDNGYTFWTFTTGQEAKGTYKVIYKAETTEEVITKEISIKVGDNVAPTLTYNAGDLTQNYIYNGVNDIEVVLEVNKKAKTFVVKVINEEKEIIAHNIGLVISDNDDSLSSGNVNMSWTKLEYELTGDHVTKGTTTTEGNTTKTQYLINGVGEYSLKFKMTDSYDNVNDKKSIKFNVVSKATVEEEDTQTVVGAVLIVVSLVLLAGVILFFALTGKKGKGTKTSKTNKTVRAKRQPKAVKEVETQKVEETKEDETEDSVTEETTEIQEDVVEEVQEKVDEEPKSGDVE